MKTRLLFAFASLLLAGCASFSAPESFRYREIDTEFFRLASWQKLTDVSKPLRVYIEGDGYAFNAHGRPSSNPTPRETDFRALAFGDPHANVVYLARPCQYVEDSRCNRFLLVNGSLLVRSHCFRFKSIGSTCRQAADHIDRLLRRSPSRRAGRRHGQKTGRTENRHDRRQSGSSSLVPSSQAALVEPVPGSDPVLV